MIFRSFLVLVIIISGANICAAQALEDAEQARKAREDYCQKVLCRDPKAVRVLLKDGKVMETSAQDRTPIVLPNGWVTILLGEEIHIALEVEGDQVRNPRAIKVPSESPNTLSFRFSQDLKGDSLLVVNSTLKHIIKFDLGMMLPDGERLLKTSSCPVLGGKSLYEHWPHPIFQIVAARFRVLPAGGPLICE